MRLKNGLVELVLYVVAFAGAAIMLMPFAWMLDTSLKLPEEVQVWPPSWQTENALNSRFIPASIDHSAYSSVNYGAMSLQQMLTSGVSREKELPNVLTVNLVGTAPIRGTFYLKLSENGDNVAKYATSINHKLLDSLIIEVDSKKYPSKFKNDMEKLKSFESQPTDYLKAFITLFQYTDSPILSRIDFINGLSDSAKTSVSFFERFSPVLSKNSKLSIENGDSILVVEEKKFVKDYFSSDEYTKSTTDFILNIQRFKKGLGTLTSDDIELKSQIENLLFRTDLKEMLTKKFGKISPSLLPILDLYEMRAIKPIREWMNLIVSFENIRKFYNSSKNLEISDPQITFTFQSLKEKKKALESAFENSKVSKYYLDIADNLIKKENIKNFANLFINKLNSQVKSSILEMKYSPEQSTLVFRKLADVLANMKILYSSLSKNQKKELDSMILKESGDFNGLASRINVAFAEAYPNTVKVLVGQLKEDHNFFLACGDAPKLEGLTEKIWDNQKNITKLTSIYNDTYYTMKMLKAPSMVSKVQYFPGNGRIKIFLENINSVWFFDVKASVKAFFSFGEVMANLFQNYVDAWHAAPFARYYFNTVFVATVTTLLNIIVGVMAAFAFSKLRFWGRDFLFMLFLATMMIPGEVLLVPNFITIVKFGWFNTYYALIIPWVASAFVIFLMRQNFMTIPDELFDAAKIDGASKWRFLWTILVPLSRPVIITGALLNFVGSWNAFLWVLIVTNTPSMRTLPVGLQNFSSNAGTMYNQLMAASTFSMLPIVILFLFAQKYFIRGIARSGLK